MIGSSGWMGCGWVPYATFRLKASLHFTGPDRTIGYLALSTARIGTHRMFSRSQSERILTGSNVLNGIVRNPF